MPYGFLKDCVLALAEAASAGKILWTEDWVGQRTIQSLQRGSNVGVPEQLARMSQVRPSNHDGDQSGGRLT